MKTNSQNGNAKIIALVGIIVIAVAVLAFFSGKQKNLVEANASPQEQAEQNAPETDAAQEEVTQLEIEPGNPVVAKVGDEEIGGASRHLRQVAISHTTEIERRV